MHRLVVIPSVDASVPQSDLGQLVLHLSLSCLVVTECLGWCDGPSVCRSDLFLGWLVAWSFGQSLDLLSFHCSRLVPSRLTFGWCLGWFVP